MAPLVVARALLVSSFRLIEQSRLVEGYRDVLHRFIAGFRLFHDISLVGHARREFRIFPESYFQIIIDSVEARIVMITDDSTSSSAQVVDVSLSQIRVGFFLPLMSAPSRRQLARQTTHQQYQTDKRSPPHIQNAPPGPDPCRPDIYNRAGTRA